MLVKSLSTHTNKQIKHQRKLMYLQFSALRRLSPAEAQIRLQCPLVLALPSSLVLVLLGLSYFWEGDKEGQTDRVSRHSLVLWLSYC